MHGQKCRSSSFDTERIDALYQDLHHSDPRLVLDFGDVANSINLIRLMQAAAPDVVYSLAARSHVHASFEATEYCRALRQAAPLTP